MKVTIWVYIALWLLTVGPLWLFNMRKFRIHKPGEKTKTNGKVIALVVIVTVLLSGLWAGLFLDNKNTRYELSAEAIFNAQVEYLEGKTDAEGLKKALAPYQKEGYDLNQVLEALEAKKGAKNVRFQISDRITSLTYEKENLRFPKTQQIDRENPMYVLCKMEIDGKNSFFIIRMEQNEKMRWKMDYMGQANKEQVKEIKMPSADYGVWYGD